MTILFAFFALLFFPAAVVGHGGHGTTDSTTLIHWLLEPLHAAPIVLAIVLMAMGVYYSKKAKLKN